MISVRRIDLRPYSYAELWRQARGPVRGLDLLLGKLVGRPLVVQAVNPCREDVTPLEEGLIPPRFRKVCRGVAGECRPAGLRFLFYYGYPPFLNGMDLGAAFLAPDRRTAAFLHHCEPRWPDTFFYCVSLVGDGRILLTSDMDDLPGCPPEFEAAFLTYSRYFAEDIVLLHTQRLQGKEAVLVDEAEVGRLIAGVQNRYAAYHRQLSQGWAPSPARG
jgi:hypothetical protein